MQFIRKYKAIFIILIVVVTALLISISGEHPFLKLFLMSPRGRTVLYSNLGAEDALSFAEDYKKKGEFVKAIIAYDYVLRKDPNNVDAYTDMAWIYSYIHNYKEAKILIEKAIEKLTPDTIPERAFVAYYGAGVTYFNASNFEGSVNNEKALEYFNKAIDISKTIKDTDIKQLLSDVYYCMANIYVAEEQYDKAVVNYVKSLELEPEDNVINFSTAICYIELKQFDKAREYLSKLDSNKHKLEQIVGDIFYYTEIGDLQKARQIVEGNELQFQKELIFKNYAANYYEKSGDTARARELYIELFNEKPKSLFTMESQKIAERYHIDTTELMKRIEKEKEESYNKKVVVK